jgi:hypothetical protein
MGEAKRRAQLAAAATAQLQQGTEDIRAEGQGVWQLAIWLDPDPVALRARSLHGPYEGRMDARRALQALEGVARFIAEAPVDEPVLCGICDNGLHTPDDIAAVTLLHAYRPEGSGAPTQAMVGGVCRTCRGTLSAMELGKAVTEAHRQRLIRDLRVLPPLSPSSRA